MNNDTSNIKTLNLGNKPDDSDQSKTTVSLNILKGTFGNFDFINLANIAKTSNEIPKVVPKSQTSLPLKTSNSSMKKFAPVNMKNNATTFSKTTTMPLFNTLDGLIELDFTTSKNDTPPADHKIQKSTSCDTWEDLISELDSVNLESNLKLTNSINYLNPIEPNTTLEPISLSSFLNNNYNILDNNFKAEPQPLFKTLNSKKKKINSVNLENNNYQPAFIPHYQAAQTICPEQLFNTLASGALYHNATAKNLFVQGYVQNQNGLSGMQIDHLSSDVLEKLSDQNYDEPKNAAERFDVYNVIQQVHEMLASSVPIVEYAMPSKIIAIKKKIIIKFKNYRGGDAVAVYRPVILMPSNWLNSEYGMAFYGKIMQCHGNLVLKVETPTYNALSMGVCYHVFIQPYNTMYNAINHLVQMIRTGGDTILKILGDRTFEMSKEEFLEKRVSDMNANKPHIPQFLNETQRQAIYSMVTQTPDNPFLLFGPPGTGKTTTLIEAIHCLIESNLEDKPRKFLVCTPSNMAADNFALALLRSGGIKKTKIIRILPAYYEVSMIHLDIRDIVSRNRNLRNQKIPEVSVLKNLDIVISTIGSSIKLLNCGTDHFTHIIIDEAGQVTEPEVLVPLMLMGGKDCRFILAGDPKQLGPVIVNEILKKASFQFDKSLLMRLSEKPEYQEDPRLMVQLTDNHRSHEAIVDIASHISYNGALVPTYPEGHDSFVKHEILGGCELPIRFHAVFGKQVNHSSGSKYNMTEVHAVVSYVENLLEKTPHLKPSEIGVIAPYKEQGRKIKKCLCQYKDITVDTVEKFQGSERKVIIMTTTRTKGLGFMNEVQRFNTAITRAQQLLIVVGNPIVLAESNFWRRFMHFCFTNGCFYRDDDLEKQDWLKQFDEAKEFEDDAKWAREFFHAIEPQLQLSDNILTDQPSNDTPKTNYFDFDFDAKEQKIYSNLNYLSSGVAYDAKMYDCNHGEELSCETSTRSYIDCNTDVIMDQNRCDASKDGGVQLNESKKQIGLENGYYGGTMDDDNNGLFKATFNVANYNPNLMTSSTYNGIKIDSRTSSELNSDKQNNKPEDFGCVALSDSETATITKMFNTTT